MLWNFDSLLSSLFKLYLPVPTRTKGCPVDIKYQRYFRARKECQLVIWNKYILLLSNSLFILGCPMRTGSRKFSANWVINPLTPVPAVTRVGPRISSDVITFDQHWHHPYSSSAGGKDISNYTQIRMIGLMEPEICTEMLRRLSEKTQNNISCDYA